MLCKGEFADLRKRSNKNFVNESDEAKKWNETNVISSNFIKWIIENKSDRQQPLRKGVRIAGAWFRENLDLANAKLNTPLVFLSCRFDGNLDFSRLRTTENIVFGTSVFYGSLLFNGIEADRNIFLRSSSVFEKDVQLNYAKIQGSLDLGNSNFKGKLMLYGVRVKDDLIMTNSHFKSANLREAHVGELLRMTQVTFDSDLEMCRIKVDKSTYMQDSVFKKVNLCSANLNGYLMMSGSKFEGELILSTTKVRSINLNKSTFEKDMTLSGLNASLYCSLNDVDVYGNLIMVNISVGKDLRASDQAKFMGYIDLKDASVGGSLDLSNSAFYKDIYAENIVVGKDLFLNNGKYEGQIFMQYSAIDGNFYLYSSALSFIDLTGSEIEKRLSLVKEGSEQILWAKSSSLILKDSKINILGNIDTPDCWPDSIDLQGLSFNKITAFPPEHTESNNGFDINVLGKWLKKQKSFTLQPYAELASVLRKMGNEDVAIKILYLSKEKRRINSEMPLWFLYSLQKYIIGYGYYNFRSMYWVIFFSLLGWIIVTISERKNSRSTAWCLIYGFDMLLPIIKLEESNYRFSLHGAAKYYFYFHKIIGYVLASFLISGISGLTK